MADDDIQVPVDLPVAGTSAPDTSEPLAQPGQNAPSTGKEQPAEEAAPADTKAEAEPPEPEQPTEDKSEKKTPWFVERLAKQREELAQVRQQREEFAARLAALEQGQQQQNPNQGQKLPTQAEYQAAVRAEAARIAEAQAFQHKLSSFDSAGRKDFPDFVDRCNTVASLGGSENPIFMQAITALEDGHKVVAQLAENPQKAIEILSLPPVAMVAALARFSSQAPKPPPVSTAPKPVKPISGAAKVDPDFKNSSDSEWYRNWVKQQGA